MRIFFGNRTSASASSDGVADGGIGIGTGSGSGGIATGDSSATALGGVGVGYGSGLGGAASGETPSMPSLNSTNAHVINLDTSEVLYSKGTKYDEDIPASLTKLVTVYTVLTSGVDIESTTTIVSDDFISGGSVAYLVAGDVVSLHQLIYGALLPSGNDACRAMARYVGQEYLNAESGGVGDPIARFVTLMNTTSASIGMSDSTWVEPAGTGANSTTPADLNKVMALLAKNNVARESWRYSWYRMKVVRGGVDTLLLIENKHPREQEVGCIGGKTGTLATYNLSELWEAPNGQLIAFTTMGAASSADRLSDANAIVSALPSVFPELATPSTAWTPAVLFDTLGYSGGWWDATDISHMWQDDAGATAVTTTGQPVGKWSPKAGDSGMSFKQATATKKPIYGASGLAFDGSDDYLDFGSPSCGETRLFSDQSDKFIVYSKAGGAGTVIAKSASNATFRAYLAASYDTEAKLILRNGTVNAPQDDNALGSVIKSTVFWDGVEGGFTRLVNGCRMPLVGTANEETTQNILLGASNSGVSNFLYGSIEQIILVDNYDIDSARRLRDWSNGATISALPSSASQLTGAAEASGGTGTGTGSGTGGEATGEVGGSATASGGTGTGTGSGTGGDATGQISAAASGGTGTGIGSGAGGTATGGGITWPLESDVRLGVSYGPTGTEYTGTMTGSGATAEEIAAAVLAAMQTSPTPFPSNVTHFNGNPTQGSGQPGDPVRPL